MEIVDKSKAIPGEERKRDGLENCKDRGGAKNRHQEALTAAMAIADILRDAKFSGYQEDWGTAGFLAYLPLKRPLFASLFPEICYKIQKINK